jgi:hypothetical protein
MMQEMQIKDMNDWYNITSADFERHGGMSMPAFLLENAPGLSAHLWM